MFLLCLFALLSCSVAHSTANPFTLSSSVTQINAGPVIEWPRGGEHRNAILPSMKCERRCLPPEHVYEVSLIHDRRGCTEKAKWNPELMDNIGQRRTGRRLTGRLEEPAWHGWDRAHYCEQEETTDCAPSYHYYAVFAKGCVLSANGTIESYKTYTMAQLARMIDNSVN